jgi:alpha-N-arabinofuranosidase
VNFGNSKVNLKVSIDGLGLSSQLSGSTKTVLTSSNLMDENSFANPKKVSDIFVMTLMNFQWPQNLSIPVYVANLLTVLASSRNAGGASPKYDREC